MPRNPKRLGRPCRAGQTIRQYLRQPAREGVLVSERGPLQIAWPILIADNNPLLATATQPDLMGDPPAIRTFAMIAERWRNDREDNVRCFRNNVQSGIHAFEDDAIQTALAEWPQI